MFSLLNQNVRDIINGYVQAEPNLTLSIGVSIGGERHILVIDKGALSEERSYLYDLGSITKVYTATLLAKLVCDGTIKLDDSLSDYMPIVKSSPTVLDLATHFGYNPYICPSILLTYLAVGLGTSANFYKKQTRNSLIKFCNRHTYNSANKYSYNDLNYALIGEVIALSKNSTYKAVMNEFLSNELGLSSTGFTSSEKQLDSYKKKRKVSSLKWSEDNPFLSAGGLKTNIVDSISFLEKCMLCKEDYQRLAQAKRKSFKGIKTRLAVGLGWHMYTSGNYLFHKGASACFRANYVIDKRKKIAISVLANARGNINFNTMKLSVAIYKSLKKAVKEGT